MKTNSLLLLGAVAAMFSITGCEGPEANDDEVFIELTGADNEPAGEGVCMVVEEGDKGPLPPREPPRTDEPATADASVDSADSADSADAGEKEASAWYCSNQSNGCATTSQVAAMCGQLNYSYINQYKYLYNVTVCGSPVAHSGCTVTCQKKGSSPQAYGQYWISCNDGWGYSGWW
jgi:hypothetical protein